MKKCILTALILVLTLAAFGCKSEGEARIADDPNIPSFVANPPVDKDYIYGVGSSSFKKQGDALKQADALAKVDIAEKLKTEVQSMVIDYTRNAGTEDNQTSLDFYESISRQLSNATLTNVEVVKREKMKNGSLWSLLRMSKSDAARDAAAAVAQAYENEASKYAEFKAMEALKMMEEQLDK
ncbi:MAG: LPP20 family lipoprotein [Treponema sp.]|jgi:hypothetical protein|nr:LPP20 family lipoprotein [Treponema sp.]